MKESRDFKGVWIPKEIWLSTELKMLGKVILTEINSLDNEDHCTAGNEYLAEFCSCSLSAVSKAIKHLKELGYIEELEFDGRHRKIRVVKNTNQGSKIYEADSQNLLANNIDNKLINKKVLSKDNTTEFSFGGKQKPKKDNLYTKCISLIHDYTNDPDLEKALIDYLQVRLEMKDKPLYSNSWKGLLNKLDREFDASERLAVVRQSIERGYASFFPVNKAYTKDYDVRKGKPWEEGVRSSRYTEKELEELAELDRQRQAQGLRTHF